MTIESPKFDVAISFLSKDSHMAAALYEKLSQGLNVFFFPRKQEDLAGTDGLESMRTPFYDDCRVTVVLYSDPWGKTPWTRVEETAIKDGCLAFGWQRLFFLTLDQSALPIWLPHTHVRFNYAEYGLDQAVGAIKARVQEQGGHALPMTPAKRAEMLQAEEQFRDDKQRMNSETGLNCITASVRVLFTEIERLSNELQDQNRANVRCGIVFRERQVYQECVITNGYVGIHILYNQPYTNMLTGTELAIREYKSALMLPAEAGTRFYINPPRIDRETTYLPDLSLAREYGWVQKGKKEFLSAKALANRSVIALLDLASRTMRESNNRR
jgi:hypothetical protein